MTRNLILTNWQYKYFIQYLLTACGPPEEGFAECCFDDEPLFYVITIIDHEVNKDMVIICYLNYSSWVLSSLVTGHPFSMTGNR